MADILKLVFDLEQRHHRHDMPYDNKFDSPPFRQILETVVLIFG